jgi:predicted transposase/invertase (TIGR01784 family)
MDLRNSIGEAIKWGINEGILTAFLAQHGSEVQNMLYTEFNIDIAKEVWQEEAREDAFAEGEAVGEARGEARGKAEGKAEGEAETQIKMARVLLALNVPVETIQKASGMTQEEIEKLRESN